jgi:hypothetical protein
VTPPIDPVVPGATIAPPPTPGPTDRRVPEQAPGVDDIAPRESPKPSVQLPNRQSARPAHAPPPAPIPETEHARTAQPIEPAQTRTDQAPNPDPNRNLDVIRDSLTRANQLLERGDYEGAVRAFESVIALDPADASAREGVDRIRRAQAAEERVLRRLKEPA